MLERFQAGQPLLSQLTAHRLNRILREIEARTPQPGSGTLLETNSAGFLYSVKRGKGKGSIALGFQITGAADATVTVSPSVVTGLDSVYVPESDGGTALDAETAPTFSVSGSGTVIYLRIEIQPSGEQIYGSSPVAYELSESTFTVVGSRVTVVTDASDQQLAQIDSGTGELVQNGIYYIPLGKATYLPDSDSVRVDAQYLYGPIGVKFCRSGLLTIAPPVIVHSGVIDEIA